MFRKSFSFILRRYPSVHRHCIRCGFHARTAQKYGEGAEKKRQRITHPLYPEGLQLHRSGKTSLQSIASRSSFLSFASSHYPRDILLRTASRILSVIFNQVPSPASRALATTQASDWIFVRFRLRLGGLLSSKAAWPPFRPESNGARAVHSQKLTLLYHFRGSF